jgi:hypothetical protein
MTTHIRHLVYYTLLAVVIGGAAGIGTALDYFSQRLAGLAVYSDPDTVGLRRACIRDLKALEGRYRGLSEDEWPESARDWAERARKNLEDTGGIPGP